jgi:hypothetical protein
MWVRRQQGPKPEGHGVVLHDNCPRISGKSVLDVLHVPGGVQTCITRSDVA